jgi:uncharacterized membrane protein
MADPVAGQSAFLMAELMITEAQMPQWNAFADAFASKCAPDERDAHNHDAGRHGGQDGAPMTALDRLDRMERMVSGMLEAVKGTRAALALLYAPSPKSKRKRPTSLFMDRWAWVGCNSASAHGDHAVAANCFLGERLKGALLSQPTEIAHWLLDIMRRQVSGPRKVHGFIDVTIRVAASLNARPRLLA